jgi:hypothetical protein
MKAGDLVTGVGREWAGIMTITPLDGAVGLVLGVDSSLTLPIAQVLYKDYVYNYFLSELRVLDETDGDDQDCVLQGGQAGVASPLHPLVDPEPVQPR